MTMEIRLEMLDPKYYIIKFRYDAFSSLHTLLAAATTQIHPQT
jgi:hypothetical protein